MVSATCDTVKGLQGNDPQRAHKPPPCIAPLSVFSAVCRAHHHPVKGPPCRSRQLSHMYACESTDAVERPASGCHQMSWIITTTGSRCGREKLHGADCAPPDDQVARFQQRSRRHIVQWTCVGRPRQQKEQRSPAAAAAGTRASPVQAATQWTEPTLSRCRISCP